jgi:hypothetical protein
MKAEASITERSVKTPASITDQEFMYPVVPAHLDGRPIERWIAVRFRVSDPAYGEQSGRLAPGMLVPYFDRAIDANWVFSHGVYFRNANELRVALDTIGDNGKILIPTSLFDLADGPGIFAPHDGIGEILAQNLGHRRPSPLNPPMMNGLFLERFAGQEDSNAVLLVPGVGFHLDEDAKLRQGYYFRDLAELQRAVGCLRTRIAGPLFIQPYRPLDVDFIEMTGGESEGLGWRGAFEPFERSNEVIQWLMSEEVADMLYPERLR